MPRKIFRQPAVVALLLLFSCLSLYQMHIANVRIPISKGLDITLLPKEYKRPDTQSEYCEARFGKNYLHAFELGSASYCSEDSDSQLTCFSNNIDPDGVQTDSFCIGGPTTFVPEWQQFLLQCKIRDFSPGEIQTGIIPLSEFPNYPQQTGPTHIFDNYIKTAIDVEYGSQSKDTKAPTAVLIKREDTQNNPWNGLLEIMSTYLTLDILRMTINPTTGAHYFSSSEFDNTQIIILDTIEEGSYFDLWHLFARKPIIHLSNLTTLSTPTIFSKIIVPLPGGSNPFSTQTTTQLLNCQNSTLLRAFSSRVLYAYNIATSTTRLIPITPSSSTPLKLTFINNPASHLLSSNRLLTHLSDLYPTSTLQINIVDYTTLPFTEQLSLTHDDTDILISVSDPLLSHIMFLKAGSSVVELAPSEGRDSVKTTNKDREFYGSRFQNLARMMEDVSYHRIAMGNNDVVEIDEDHFLKTVGQIVDEMVEKRGMI